MNGWIGVDLDGTLAYQGPNDGICHIGRPIESMLENVKLLLKSGIEVKIYTARAACGMSQVKLIQDWLQQNGLPRLEVTDRKDFHMIECWDDRAIQVVANKGRFVKQIWPVAAAESKFGVGENTSPAFLRIFNGLMPRIFPIKMVRMIQTAWDHLIG